MICMCESIHECAVSFWRVSQDSKRDHLDDLESSAASLSVEVDDFLQDIMKPQMEALFYQYETDILWCDVGGPTVLPDIAPEWFNRAKQEGRQVIANARCGANYSDFDVSLGCGLKDVRTD